MFPEFIWLKILKDMKSGQNDFVYYYS